MDFDALGPEQAALMRARLHLRSVRRRIREGKASDGIILLYDALLYGMRWRLLSPGVKEQFDALPGEEKRSIPALHEILTRSGILDGTFDAQSFQSLVDDTVEEKLDNAFDHAETLGAVESVLSALGVTPFDETALPPEKPAVL
jgi:hypothetical protein